MNFNKSDQSWRSALWKPTLCSFSYLLFDRRRSALPPLWACRSPPNRRQPAGRFDRRIHLPSLRTPESTPVKRTPSPDRSHESPYSQRPSAPDVRRPRIRRQSPHESGRGTCASHRSGSPRSSSRQVPGQFVVRPRYPAQRNGLTFKTQQPAWSSETELCRPEPTKTHPKPFFTQWLETWRNRNEKAS